jgi:hypothetical protein
VKCGRYRSHPSVESEFGLALESLHARPRAGRVSGSDGPPRASLACAGAGRAFHAAKARREAVLGGVRVVGRGSVIGPSMPENLYQGLISPAVGQSYHQRCLRPAWGGRSSRNDLWRRSHWLGGKRAAYEAFQRPTGEDQNASDIGTIRCSTRLA